MNWGDIMITLCGFGICAIILVWACCRVSGQADDTAEQIERQLAEQPGLHLSGVFSAIHHGKGE